MAWGPVLLRASSLLCLLTTAGGGFASGQRSLHLRVANPTTLPPTIPATSIPIPKEAGGPYKPFIAQLKNGDLLMAARNASWGNASNSFATPAVLWRSTDSGGSFGEPYIPRNSVGGIFNCGEFKVWVLSSGTVMLACAPPHTTITHTTDLLPDPSPGRPPRSS